MTLTLDALQESFTRLLTPASAGGKAPETGEAQAKPEPVLASAQPTASGPGGPEVAPASTAAKPALVASAPPPVPSCRIVDNPARGQHFEVFVTPDLLVEAARLMDAHGFAIDTVTGVDWLAAGEMELVYDFYHPSSPIHAVLRCRVPREAAEVPTLSEVYPGANWHERETHDFFGIRFTGHPDLSPFLLPEDATYHPLRKDFTGVA